jgi:hypothetical protein
MGLLPAIGVVRHRTKLLRHLWRLERKGNPGRPNLRLLSRGFLSNRAWLYPFDRFDHDMFLTDLEAEARLPRLNTAEAQALLGDKRRFHLWVRTGAFPAACPELLGFVEDGQAKAPDGGALELAAINGRAMIAKPIDGSGGRDVSRVSSVDEVGKRGSFLLESMVVQHPYASSIYPHAVNTIRVIVGHDDATLKTVLLGAAHRFGTRRSAPTDNFKAGGIVSFIDLRTGQLSDAICDKGGPRRETLQRHPETGSVIAGATVPRWNEIKALALECTRAVAGLAYVGWDIALLEDGPVVIEGNAALANPNLVQFHEPILMRKEAQDFFAAKGVISERRLKLLRAMDG